MKKALINVATGVVTAIVTTEYNLVRNSLEKSNSKENMKSTNENAQKFINDMSKRCLLYKNGAYMDWRLILHFDCVL